MPLHNPLIGDPTFYVISDTHFYHDNIVKYCNRMEHTGGRDHNLYILEKWNSVVGPDDQILHLGDLFAWFKDGKEKFEYNILPRLNGKKYLIMGNHDKEHKRVYRNMGFTVLEPFEMDYQDKKVSFNHYPWPGNEWHAPSEIRVHGHIHNNGYPKTDNWKDGTESSLPNQINVSVEVIDYTPQRINEILAPLIQTKGDVDEGS